MRWTLALFVLVFCSCRTTYYAPNTANIPLLSEAGEVRLSGGLSTGLTSAQLGGELQAAYATGDKTGVLFSSHLGSVRRTVTRDGSTTRRDGRLLYAEAGFGLYDFQPGRDLQLELYAGGGRGTFRYDFDFGDRSAVGFTKLFLQPAVGVKRTNFEAAFTPKLSYIFWSVTRDDINSGNNIPRKAELDNIRATPGFFAIEPAFLLRVGGERTKAFFASSFCIPSVASGEGHRENINLSTGVSFSLFARARR